MMTCGSRTRRAAGVLFVIILVACARDALSADLVEMINGQRFRGTVLEETDDQVVMSVSMRRGSKMEMKLKKTAVHAITIGKAERRVINEKGARTRRTPAPLEEEDSEPAPEGLVRTGRTSSIKAIAEHHAGIYKRCAPAVVGITCKNDTHHFYGTGVTISPRGVILTLVSTVPPDARNIRVYFAGGKKVDATIIESVQEVEATLLQVPLKDLPFLALGRPEQARLGDVVYTLANPDSVIMKDGRPAFSVGVLSGIYSIVGREEYSPYKGLVLETDASINRGSDGGPMLDRYGRLLGVISLSYSDSRFMGTAIPVHVIKQRMRKFNLVFGLKAAASKVKDTRFCPGLGAVEKLLRRAAAPIVKSVVTLKVDHNDRGPAELTVAEKRRNPRRAMQVKQQRFVKGTDAPTTAVVMSRDGHLLTAYSNVSGSIGAISALFPGGAEVSVKLLGYDEELDIACLKAEVPRGARLNPVKLSPAGGLPPGAVVALMGRSEPEVDVNLNTGIVSANDRNQGRALQADFLTNYGNQGGPVITLTGKVVGISAFLNAKSKWNQNSGVSLVTKSENILEVWDDLKGGKVRKRRPRASMGVELTIGATDVAGARIERVQPNSAAAEAGLKPGDVVVEFAGKPVKEWSDLVQHIRRAAPGDEVELKVIRAQGGGDPQAVKITLKERSRGVRQ